MKHQIEITGERKSSASSNPNGCIQVGHADCRRAPRKSSASGGGGTNSVVVEIRSGTSLSTFGDLIAAHSDLPGLERFVMLATRAEWEAFIKGVKRGEFDLDSEGLLPALQS